MGGQEILNSPILESTRYYDLNSQNYFDTTVGYDVSKLYALFLPYLSKGARILDAGCGSGRDAKFFKDQGYKVTAFDGSLKMATLASKFTGLQVAHKDFSAVDDKEEFDGIWTSASLLHVPKDNLLDILHKFKEALKPQGIWYMSFRYGQTEKYDKDRYFYDQTELSLKRIVETLEGFKILHLSVPEDTRSRRGYKFVVCTLIKQ